MTLVVLALLALRLVPSPRRLDLLTPLLERGLLVIGALLHLLKEPSLQRQLLEYLQGALDVAVEHFDREVDHRLPLRARCRCATFSARACLLADGHVPALLPLWRRFLLGF